MPEAKLLCPELIGMRCKGGIDTMKIQNTLKFDKKEKAGVYMCCHDIQVMIKWKKNKKEKYKTSQMSPWHPWHVAWQRYRMIMVELQNALDKKPFTCFVQHKTLTPKSRHELHYMCLVFKSFNQDRIFLNTSNTTYHRSKSIYVKTQVLWSKHYYFHYLEIYYCLRSRYL